MHVIPLAREKGAKLSHLIWGITRQGLHVDRVVEISDLRRGDNKVP